MGACKFRQHVHISFSITSLVRFYLLDFGCCAFPHGHRLTHQVPLNTHTPGQRLLHISDYSPCFLFIPIDIWLVTVTSVLEHSPPVWALWANFGLQAVYLRSSMRAENEPFSITVILKLKILYFTQYQPRMDWRFKTAQSSGVVWGVQPEWPSWLSCCSNLLI